MKETSIYVIISKVFLVCLALMFGYNLTYSQVNVPVKFRHANKTYEGIFTYAIQFPNKTDITNRQTGFEINAEKAEGKIYIKFLGFKVIGNPDTLKKAFGSTLPEILVDNSWIKLNGPIEQEKTHDYRIQFRPGQKARAKTCRLRLTGNGDISISFEFAAVPPEKVGNSIPKNERHPEKISRKYTVVSFGGEADSGSGSEEEVAWKKVEEGGNSIPDLKNFISKFPEGKYLPTAKQRLKLNENTIYNDAISKSKGSNPKSAIPKINDYLKYFPSGGFATELKNLKKKIESSTSKPTAAKEKTTPAKEKKWETDFPNLRTLDDYSTFISNYKNEPEARSLVQTAEKKIAPIGILPQKLSRSTYTYEFTNVFKPQVEEITDADGVDYVDAGFQSSHRLENVRIRDGESHDITIYDPEKPEGVNRQTFNMTDVMDVSFQNLEDGGYNVNVEEGGEPPFSLFFIKDNQQIVVNRFPDRNFNVIASDYSDGDVPKGIYSLRIQDKKGLAFDLQGAEIEIIPKQLFEWYYLLIIPALFIPVLIFRLVRGQRKKKLTAINEERKRKEGFSQRTDFPQEPVSPVTTEVITNGTNMNREEPPKEKPVEKKQEPKKKEKPVEKKQEPVQKEVTETPKKEAESNPKTVAQNPQSSQGRLVIKSFREKTKEEEPLEAILAKGKYYRLEMAYLWSDTSISDLYLSRKAIGSIHTFLINQKNEHLEEKEGTIPEIGGFLVGRYQMNEESRQYRVLAEEFIPIHPEDNNVYQLEFSTESLSAELGDIQDKFPDLSLVGWFHTHPGHGLFLSKPDLTIHEGFFRQRYQFAMEIDTLTSELDLGFFTRKLNGKVNNTDGLIPGSSWFEWTQVAKSIWKI